MTLIEVAKSQVGVQEIPRGSNWGEPVKTYLAAVGVKFPASWCMAFVYWCAQRAAEKQGKVNVLLKTGGVLAQWNKVGKQYRHLVPAVGDVFIMDFGGGLGHTGIVTAIYGDKMTTIEGNTNDTGSREGYEVCFRERSIKKCKGFIRTGL